MKFKFVIFQLIFLNLISCQSGSATEDTKLYQEVLPHALAIRDAILNRRIDILASYSNPNPMYSYKKYIEDPSSEEIKYLYDDEWNKLFRPEGRSVYQALKDMKKMKIEFVKYIQDGEIIIIAFYYDESKFKLKLPLTGKQEELWKVDFFTCRFTKVKNTWKVAYAVFDYGTDYLSNHE